MITPGATRTPSLEDTLAYNHWQLEQERIGRERRMALRAQRFFRPLPPGWWKRPVLWAVIFSFLFIARDAFAALLVDLLVLVG
ncbi:MAG TPA: hypothetical protein ENI69_04270, partial [Rhodospirillales bacterium]|nr:hypothetical protein [Rhodospirillales bacterium]